MKIIEVELKYLSKLVILFEEYRTFCGFEEDKIKSEIFLKGLMDRNDSILFIAIDIESDQLMGFVNLYPSYSSLAMKRLWILNDLAVSRKFRGFGVAKQLIHKVKSFAIESNAIRIELKTERTNLKAINLYKSLEFQIDSENIYYRVPTDIELR